MVNLKCPWDMCEHCNLGVCECKEDVELKTVTYSDHEEFMVCKSFKGVDVIEALDRLILRSRRRRYEKHVNGS